MFLSLASEVLKYRAEEGLEVNPNATIVLDSLSMSLYRASLYMIYHKGPEALKELSNAEANATEALGAFIDLVRFMADIARVNVSDNSSFRTVAAMDMALALKVYGIHQIDVCIDERPDPKFRVLDREYVMDIVDRMIENPYSVTLDQAMMVITYAIGIPRLAVAYKQIAGHEGEAYAQDVLQRLGVIPFKIPMCLGDLTGLDDPRLRAEWYRIPCISTLYTSKLEMLASLLASRPSDPEYREWVFPLPSPSFYNLSQLIPLLDTLSRISQLLSGLNVSITVQKTSTGMTGEPLELNRTPAIDPTEVDKSLREILEELGAGNASSPLSRVIDSTSMTDDRGETLNINERLGLLSRIRIEDFRRILESLSSARSTLFNNTLRLPSLNESSIQPGGIAGIGVKPGLPSIPATAMTPIFALALAAFAAYMMRDNLRIMAGYLIGRTVSRMGGRKPGSDAALCYSRLVDALGSMGYGKRASETPREYLERVRDSLDTDMAEGLASATRAYEAYKYAESEPRSEDLSLCWTTVRRAASPWRYLRR